MKGLYYETRPILLGELSDEAMLVAACRGGVSWSPKVMAKNVFIRDFTLHDDDRRRRTPMAPVERTEVLPPVVLEDCGGALVKITTEVQVLPDPMVLVDKQGHEFRVVGLITEAEKFVLDNCGTAMNRVWAQLIVTMELIKPLSDT